MKFDIYPAKGSFAPGTEIVLIAENDGGADRIMLRITKKQERCFPMKLQPGKNILPLPDFAGEPGGYGVEAEFYRASKLLFCAYSAFDIVSSGTLIRYGFLSDFSDADYGDKDITSMLKLHVNAVQFYDWSYRHDDLVSSENRYTDMMGKENNLQVIRQKIKACHQHGMKALAYGAVYAASAQYQSAHPRQSLYDRNGMPLCFIDTFSIMNISRESRWHDHILNEYRKAMEQVGFDGIHMDTYGEPKAACDWNGEIQYLDEQFGPLIEDAAVTLEKDGAAPVLIFNNVGGWPVGKTLSASQSAVYIEVWPPHTKYCHLGNLIREALRGKKPVILAAYPAAFRMCRPESALESQLYLSFVIAMHGATQLFFGEQNAVITQGYYADYTVLNQEQLAAIRTYQDFFVRYEEFFYDTRLEDVSMTHQGWDNREYLFSPAGSADGASGMIWYHIRQSRDTKVIYFVNLSENDNLWAEEKKKPSEKRTVSAQIEIQKVPQSVWFASPDEAHGSRQECLWSIPDGRNEILAEVEIFRCGILVVEM